MKLVIADASPIHYLVLIGAAHVLPEMFTKVVIPEHIVSHGKGSGKGSKGVGHNY